MYLIRMYFRLHEIYSSSKSLEKVNLNVTRKHMAYIRIIWITCCEYYFIITIKMNAFVTDDVTHCRPLGENVDCKPKSKQNLCHFKLTLETICHFLSS